jgi:O-antigen biosynthesis protein
MKPFKVSIIIPNWNGKELLRKHLPFVIKHSGKSEIIVVDDKSTDDSIDYLQKNFPEVIIIRKENHSGFAGAVNIGVQSAQGEIVVLLNTDVEPEEGYLDNLLIHFLDNKVFAVGCLEKSYETDNIILRGRGLAHWEKGFYIHRRGDVDGSDTAWVNGGAGAFRKDIWDTLNGMNEIYNPFYWEDIDISYRAVKKGYKLIFEPESIIKHYHENGIIKDKFSENTVRIISYRNQFIFIWGNFPNIGVICEHLVYLPIRLIQAFINKDFAMILGFNSAILRLIRWNFS